MLRETDSDWRWKGLRIVLGFSAAFMVAVTLLRIHTCWINDAYLNLVSGVWTALAKDLTHGVFYRPLYGPLGYGGTRYFPLVFVLHAGLMKLGGGLILTGFLLSFASTLALLAGVYALLRRLGVDKLLAGCSSLFVLCSESTQLALLTIRGDVLPAALVVWGFWACCSPAPGFRQLMVAAAFFTLAFSAKVTSVYALGAALFYFWFRGGRRQALLLASLCAGAFAIVLAAMLIASHGRVIQIFLECATAGAPWTSFFRVPQRFVMLTSTKDVGGFPFLVLAAAALVAWPGKFWRELPALFFLFAAAMLLLIFGTPGTDYNHLIDLHAAAVVVLAVWISRSGRQPALFGLAALEIVALLAVFPATRNFRHGADTFSRQQEFQTVLRIVGRDPKPILSDNPLIPVLAGQSPYVLDPFMFRVLDARDPRFDEPLLEMLQKKDFSAVVTSEDGNSMEGESTGGLCFYGPDFRKTLLANYKLYLVMHSDHIYLPRRP